MGIPLLPFLPHEPSTFLAPLPSRTSTIRSHCRCSVELCLLRNNQLSHLSPWAINPSAAVAIFRYWPKSTYQCFHLHLNYACPDTLHGPLDLWNTRVSMICISKNWLSLHFPFYSLDGEAVNNRRLLSTWTLHFAAKKTDYSV